MKEHGLLLSDPMVRAYAGGHKSQTRRVIAAHNSLVDGRGVSARVWAAYQWDWDKAWVDDGPSPAGNPGPYLHVPSKAPECDGSVHRIYPRFRPSDVIWWKETHYVERAGDAGGTGFVIYRATDDPAPVGRWSPSLLMPRWAARFTSPIQAVRAERLADISKADARAEGVQWNMVHGVWHVPGIDVSDDDRASRCYTKLMQHLHGEGILKENPWLWAISFPPHVP